MTDAKWLIPSCNQHTFSYHPLHARFRFVSEETYTRGCHVNKTDTGPSLLEPLCWLGEGRGTDNQQLHNRESCLYLYARSLLELVAHSEQSMNRLDFLRQPFVFPLECVSFAITEGGKATWRRWGLMSRTKNSPGRGNSVYNYRQKWQRAMYTENFERATWAEVT